MVPSINRPVDLGKTVFDEADIIEQIYSQNSRSN